MNNILSLEEVIEEVKFYFDLGKGNPLLKEPIINHMISKKEVPHAVLISLELEKITAWKRKG